MIGILQLVDITVDFNGFCALKKLNLYTEPNELRFIIGPNGAGKTTLLDIICGKISPTKGDIYFDNSILLRMKPYELSRRGIGRKFQAASVFSEFSAWENMEISTPHNRGFFHSIVHKISKEDTEKIYEILSVVGLVELRDKKAKELSHGQKQWLEIAMVMMQNPKLFLMDEPVAGMTRQERERTGELLNNLIEKGYSIIVVEHDMHFVKEYSKTISVIHEGSLLSEGTFAKISSDKRVRNVYLGR